MTKDRILLVDDEKNILELGRRFLVAEGFEVETALDATQAIAWLERAPFELLLTDISIPGMNGLDLMKAARSIRPDLVIVVITGHGTITTAIESLKIGATGFLLKPFTRDEFLSVVRHALDKHRLRRENIRMKSLMPLFQVSQRLMMQTDLTSLLERIVELIKKETRVDQAGIMLLDRKKEGVTVAAAFGEGGKKRGEMEEMARRVIAEKKPILLRDQGADDPSANDRPEQPSAASLLGVPILLRNKVIGVLHLSKFGSPSSLEESDLGLISIFCGQAAVAIENARLYREIRNSYLRTLQSLVAAIEIKDPFSKGHSSGVAHCAAVIGKALRLPKERIQDLVIAALLHDIGKLGSSDDILKKASRLSEEEFELMKSHPGNAVRILETIGLSQEILSSILHHHEWWDGSGYPDRLSGEAIPLFARIIAIADTVVTMTMPRLYRSKVSPKEAREEIKGYRRRQFDPDLVDLFLTIGEEVFVHSGRSDLEALLE
ncbi:MAG: HD domain-containing phosphohydrolase [Candidatus Manganitrophaceae bacterium]